MGGWAEFGAQVKQHIGIVGVSPEGAALCYRQIYRHAAHTLPPEAAPVVTVHSEPVQQYVRAIQANDWQMVAHLLAASARVLSAAGATFCCTPDNAVQFAIPLAEGSSPIPWLPMTDLVAQALERDGRKAVGIIGTKTVTLGAAYQTHLGLKGIQVLAPTLEEAEAVDQIIYAELLFGSVRSSSRERVHRVIEGLASRGCDAVVLACSEAPLIVSAETCPLPMYDAADLLAQGAVAWSVRD